MTDEHPLDQVDEVSPEFKVYLAIARGMFFPALALAGLGTLGCIAIATLGEFKCAERALNLLDYPGTRDFLVIPLFSVLALAMVRQMGRASGEMFEKMRSEFELYNYPMFEMFSTKVTVSLFVFVITVFLGLGMLCIPVGIAFANLRPLWIVCMMTSGAR